MSNSSFEAKLWEINTWDNLLKPQLHVTSVLCPSQYYSIYVFSSHARFGIIVSCPQTSHVWQQQLDFDIQGHRCTKTGIGEEIKKKKCCTTCLRHLLFEWHRSRPITPSHWKHNTKLTTAWVLFFFLLCLILVDGNIRDVTGNTISWLK